MAGARYLPSVLLLETQSKPYVLFFTLIYPIPPASNDCEKCYIFAYVRLFEFINISKFKNIL